MIVTSRVRQAGLLSTQSQDRFKRQLRLITTLPVPPGCAYEISSGGRQHPVPIVNAGRVNLARFDPDLRSSRWRRDLRDMRLLVLGGTRFVGRAIVRAALGRGWEVTAFNRGVSGTDVPGTTVVRGDRTRVDDLARLAAAGPWDSVIDTSGYVPLETLKVCERLEPVTDRYVFISTVSVYRQWPVAPLSEVSEALYCPPDAGSGYGEDVEDGPTKYGYQKAGCERAVTETFGPTRSAILRPSVVLGPGEYVGRLPWWLRRVAADARVLAPGSPAGSFSRLTFVISPRSRSGQRANVAHTGITT